MSNSGTDEWQKLYDAIVKTYPSYQYVKKPNSETLDEFEIISGFQLPQSYRDFICIFGPGELGQRFRIHAPGYKRPNHNWDLWQFIKDYRVWKRDFFNTYQAEQHARLMVFCDTIGGDLIGWDPEDVRHRDNREYGIYFWPHNYREASLIATSFDVFIRDFCLGVGYFRFWKMEPEWDLDDEQQSFSPASDLERAATVGTTTPASASKKGRKKSTKTKLVSTGVKRRFEFADGTSDKFWEIEQQGISVVVCFGRMGSRGQTKTKEFSSEGEAAQHIEKLIREKSEKGYVEVK